MTQTTVLVTKGISNKTATAIIQLGNALGLSQSRVISIETKEEPTGLRIKALIEPALDICIFCRNPIEHSSPMHRIRSKETPDSLLTLCGSCFLSRAILKVQAPSGF